MRTVWRERRDPYREILLIRYANLVDWLKRGSSFIFIGEVHVFRVRWFFWRRQSVWRECLQNQLLTREEGCRVVWMPPTSATCEAFAMFFPLTVLSSWKDDWNCYCDGWARKGFEWVFIHIDEQLFHLESFSVDGEYSFSYMLLYPVCDGGQRFVLILMDGCYLAIRKGKDFFWILSPFSKISLKFGRGFCRRRETRSLYSMEM